MKWLLSLIFLFSSLQAHDKSFVFVIPSFNNAKWYEKNLDSIFSQTCQHFRVIYIDDASSDGTGNLVENYIEENDLKDRVTLIKNRENVGALANLYTAIWMCGKEEIVINLDGDDWLAHPQVVEHLCQAYSNPEVWMTYGQFIYYPSWEMGFATQVPDEVVQTHQFRHNHSGTTALRTFYASLFHHIKKEDLCDEDGQFYQAGYDMAMMIPILEMAGTHSRFMPEVSYVYNIGTGINDFQFRSDIQASVDHIVRAKTPYPPLMSIWGTEIKKKVLITPGYWGDLFAIDNPLYNRDDCLRPLYMLREKAAEKGINLEQVFSVDQLPEFDYLIVFEVFEDQLPFLAQYPKEKLILMLWEPPSVLPQSYDRKNHEVFSKVFTWHDDFVDNQKYFKFHYPVYHPMIEDPISFYWKRFATFIGGNKHSNHPDELYTARQDVIRFYEDEKSEKGFDFYGRGWSSTLHNYVGLMGDKTGTLPHYKFNYSYENIAGIPGYVTEKIFDTFQCGVVPVYWGAPNVEHYIPKNCFIDRRDFKSESDLYDYLKSMDYRTYFTYLENIKKYLKSEKAALFSPEHFVETLLPHLEGP